MDDLDVVDLGFLASGLQDLASLGRFVSGSGQLLALGDDDLEAVSKSILAGVINDVRDAADVLVNQSAVVGRLKHGCGRIGDGDNLEVVVPEGNPADLLVENFLNVGGVMAEREGRSL